MKSIMKKGLAVLVVASLGFVSVASAASKIQLEANANGTYTLVAPIVPVENASDSVDRIVSIKNDTTQYRYISDKAYDLLSSKHLIDKLGVKKVTINYNGISYNAFLVSIKALDKQIANLTQEEQAIITSVPCKMEIPADC